MPMLLEAAKEYIDEYTGTSFGADSAEVASERLYDGNGRSTLDIDLAHDVEAIEVLNEDGTVAHEYENVDYQLKPSNDEAKRWIVMQGIGRFPIGTANIRVTAKWAGYTKIPAKIKLAATILASSYVNSTDNLKSESIEGYTRTFQDAGVDTKPVNSLLDSFDTIDI